MRKIVLLPVLLVAVSCNWGGGQSFTAEIVTEDLPAAVLGQQYDFQLEGTVSPFLRAEWRLKDGSLPVGMRLTSDGRLTGTPTETGDFSFTVQLVAQGATFCRTAEREFTLAVNAQLEITTSTLPAAYDGQTGYSAVVAASGGTGSYTWSVVSGSLPPNLVLDSSTGQISGDIASDASANSPYNFTVEVTDGQQSVQAHLSIEVWQKLRVATTALPEGEVSVAYSATQLIATGGKPPYTWSDVNDVLQTYGLSLDSDTGEITGTPTGATPSGGVTVTIEVRDANNETAQKNFTLVIHPELQITTNTLPDAYDGEKGYSVSLAASGGTGSYTWSIVSGSLPPNLYFDSTGLISGDIWSGASANSPYSFTVEVTDGYMTVRKSLTLRVSVFHWAVELTWARTMDDRDTHPGESCDVFVDADGVPHAVWQVNAGGAHYIVYAENAGLANAMVHSITDGTVDCRSPRVVVAGGVINIFYVQDGSMGKDLIRVSGQPGVWDGPETVASSVEQYDVAVDADGTLHVAYVTEGMSVLYYTSNDGAGWTASEEVARADSTTCVAIDAVSASDVAIAWSFTDGLDEKTVCYLKTQTGWDEVSVADTAGEVDVAFLNGKPYIAWLESGDVYYAWIENNTLSGKTNISEDGGVSGGVAVAADAAVWVGWISGGRVYYRRIYGEDKIDSEPHELTSSYASHIMPFDVTTLAISIRAGRTAFGFVESNDRVYCVYSTTMGWGYPRVVANTTGTAVYAKGVVDASGQVHVVFTDNSSGQWDINYTVWDGSNWSAPVVLDNSSQDCTYPLIAYHNDSNAVYVIWLELTGSPTPDTVTVQWCKREGNGPWTSPEDAFQVEMPGGFDTCFGSSCLVRGDKIWLFWCSVGASGRWEVFSATLDTNTDTWSSPRSVASIAGRDCHYVDAALSADGNIHIVFDAFGEISSNPTDGVIYYCYYDGVGWSTPSEISDNPGDTKAAHPVIAIDDSGNRFVFWGFKDGKAPWNSKGNKLQARILWSDGSMSQVFTLEERGTTIHLLDAVYDGKEVLVAFETAAFGTSHSEKDIMVRRASSINGSVVWSEPEYITQLPYGAYNPSFIYNESHDYLYLVWNDKRFGDYDIFFSRARLK